MILVKNWCDQFREKRWNVNSLYTEEIVHLKQQDPRQVNHLNLKIIRKIHKQYVHIDTCRMEVTCIIRALELVYLA